MTLIGLAALGIAWLVLSLTLLAPTHTHGARVIHLTVHSQVVGRDLGLNVVVPPGHERRRPLLVFLHGRSGDENSETDNVAMFAALAKLGRRAPVIAFPDGGDHGYWHDCDEADWERYVVDEVIPLAAREGDANPHRVAIGGISMGGFGAYDMPSRTRGAFARWEAATVRADPGASARSRSGTTAGPKTPS